MTKPSDESNQPEKTFRSSIDHPPSEEAIHSPHDRLFNRTMQELSAARELLRSQFPRELIDDLNLETLEHVDTSFIDANLKRRFVDRLFKVEVSKRLHKSLGTKTQYVYLLVLIDHKSSPDSLTLIQMLGYIVRIWENAIENGQPLAPIIPWVVYNGVNPWSGGTCLPGRTINLARFLM